MIGLPVFSTELIQGIFLNVTILATLLLLYTFIPDTLLKRSKLVHAASVGAVFGFAAVAGIPALWMGGAGPVLGFNFILITLAGYAGGPVSSAIVAGTLLIGSAGSGGMLSLPDILLIMSAILFGAFVYYGRDWRFFPKDTTSQLLILGAGSALIEVTSVFIAKELEQIRGVSPHAEVVVEILPYLVLTFVVAIILGSIIMWIDRKRQAERELIEYRRHLEDMVARRTAELQLITSLQRATIDSTADGIVVVDRNEVIRGYNWMAAQILSLPDSPSDILQAKWQYDTGAMTKFPQATAALLSEPQEFLSLLGELAESSAKILTRNLRFKTGRVFELYVHPHTLNDNPIGRVYSFHDITDQKLAEDATTSAHNKLVLLSTLTRHDIFNQITALAAYIELAQMRNPAHGNDLHFNAMKKILDVIRVQLEFTRDYEVLGLNKPGWERVEPAFSQAAESFQEREISFTYDAGKLEIFADPMIGRVFHNLIDNSLRHGERVTAIRLSAQTTGQDLLLIYQDNGAGILPEDKEKIFLRGFGKHTGLGMFLIREILTITGISIRETGSPGTGVRFEMVVPAGKYRFTS